MKNKFFKIAGNVAFLVAVIFCACFIVYMASLGAEYSRGVSARATVRAEYYAGEVALGVSDACDDFRREATYIAGILAGCETKEETTDEFKKIYLSGIANDRFITVFYLKDGSFINPNGETVTGYSEIDDLKNSDGTELSKLFQFENRIMTIAAFAKSAGGYADGVAVLFDRDKLSLADFRSDGKMSGLNGVSLAEFAVLIRHDGKPLDKIENSSTFSVNNDAVQSGVLKGILSGTETDEFVRAVASGRNASFVFRSGSERYALAVSSLGAENGYLAVVCAYKVSVIYGIGYDVMENIRASLIGLAVVMAVMIASLVANRIYSKKRIYNLEMIDPELNCATPKKFEADTETLMKRHKNISFAVVSLKINNFGYVTDKFGEAAAHSLMLYSAAAIRHAMYIDETFAYAGDGEFLLLLYYKERKNFTDRLNGLYLRLASYEGFKERDYKVGVSFAVYVVEKAKKQSTKDMLAKLKMVEDSAGVHIGTFKVDFYEDMFMEKRVRKAEIEGRMESALENSEFHLFYQPKYNLRTKKADGCEILIRWYDPKLESYRVPNVFLPVFEEDGFISKLDRFVFYKACENIAARVRQRKTCYPVSVNVSRVTAIQPDFVDYYVRIKNKFDIKDGFVTLEFTESFAYENYEYLGEMVEKLHANGFLCSIDDFGTGYSSYNILKSITMDEIKLDKFFLEKGLSSERDQTLLRSVIEMIKKLGMTVTQEGVETREDFERLQALGCDVIQGYYFAKPMKYVDYCEFIDKNF